jgi:polyhydroxyalkanoate synthesis regulator protein
MPAASTPAGRIEIKRYPNRRFYDSTRARHVTLADVYELIRSGREVAVTDSKTGHDITNLILMQIILERDAEKPARLGGVIEMFFRQTLEAQRASQERWNEFLRNTLGQIPRPAASPFDWTGAFMEPFVPSAPAPEPSASPPVRTAQDDELEALRSQLGALEREVQRLSRRPRRSTNRTRSARRGK